MLNQARELVGMERLMESQPDQMGYYGAIYTKNGELRCPLCGMTSWSIIDPVTINCKYCVDRGKFSYYGKLGLKLIKTNVIVFESN